MIVKLGTFKGIKPASLELLASVTSLKHLERGEHLFYDKEIQKNLYILASGAASLYKINSLGEKKAIFVYGPGNIMNEDVVQNLPSSINCEMLETGSVLVIPAERFCYIMEQDMELTKLMMNSMALKIRRLYRQMKNTTNALSGEKRLVAKLYKLARDYGSDEAEGTGIQMNLTITYLAEMLGSKRETVSRQMKHLSESGLIIMKKNHIIVPDLAKLGKYFKTP